MSYGTILSKKLSSTSICKKNCIEAELKNLHNFNPDEEVAKFAKKIVMELQFPKRLSRMSICKEYDKLQKHNFDQELAKNH